MESQKEIKVFYSAAFLSYLLNGMIGPLFIIYLFSIGINPAQIGILLAASNISIIIFEFPTGLYADNYGRKKSLLVSFGLLAMLYIIWFFSQNFYVLLIISILGGAAYTFQSGARDSLMINNLKLENNDTKRNYIFSRLSAYGHVGSLIGGLVAALLSFYLIRSIWLAASFLSIASFILYLAFVREDFIKQTSPETIERGWRRIIKSAKESSSYAIKNKPTLLLIIIGMVFALAIGAYGLGYPIFFKKIFQIPNYYFGFLGSISALMGILGVFLSEKIAKKKDYYFTISLFAIILLALYLLFGISKMLWLTFIIFMIIELFINGWYPIFQSFFNKFIPNHIRTSILSLNSSATLTIISLGNILVGFLLTFLSPNNLIIYSGVLFILIPIFLLGVKKRGIE